MTRPAAPPVHPFTPALATLWTALLAFALPAPGGPAALAALAAAAAVATGHASALRRALAICAPFTAFLLLLHAVLGDAGPAPVRAGPLTLSRAGLALALGQAARLLAISTMSLVLARTFRPGAFLDAAAARGWSPRIPFLVSSTLLTVPRLRARAVAITEAQRARGLRPAHRLAALRAVALPLIVSTLHDAETRAVALETRGVALARRRTPLAPPDATGRDRLVWWGGGLLTLAVLGWRLATA